jgi:hypothetical protein
MTTGYSYAGVLWSGTNYVAITSSGNALYSYDGLNWRVATGGSFGSNIAWTKSNEATFRAKQPTIVGGTGTANTMLYSSDGVIFRGLGTSIFSTACRTVAWNGDIWVAGGEGSANTLAYSYDGKTWTGLGKSVFSTGCYKVVSNGTVWVAMGAGSNTIATSTDGMNWVGLGVNVFDGSGVGVDWNGRQWLAVGNGSVNTLAISSDLMATSWTGLGKTVFTAGLQCVKWMMGAWFVGADSNRTTTIQSSSDGTNWTAITNGLTNSCRSVSWNGREAIATGNGTSANIIVSRDGVTWTSVSVSGITGGYGVEWNGVEWVVASGGSQATVNIVADASGNMNAFANSSAALTQGYCVGANSRVGAKVFYSRVYLNGGDKLVVYGPEYYDLALASDTSISMNMNLPV